MSAGNDPRDIHRRITASMYKLRETDTNQADRTANLNTGSGNADI
jgi:hypothetical protein